VGRHGLGGLDEALCVWMDCSIGELGVGGGRLGGGCRVRFGGGVMTFAAVWAGGMVGLRCGGGGLGIGKPPI